MNEQTIERQHIVDVLDKHSDSIVQECSLEVLGIGSKPDPRAAKSFYGGFEGSSAKEIMQNETKYLDNME